MATRRFVGGGGGVFDITVPLSEEMQYQFDKGFLRLADGEKPFDELGPEHVDPVIEYHAERVVKPKPADNKATWISYAETQGMSHEDADGMSKADLVKKFS